MQIGISINAPAKMNVCKQGSLFFLRQIPYITSAILASKQITGKYAKAKPIQPTPSIRKIKKRAAAMHQTIFRIDLRSALRCNFTSSKVSVNAAVAVSGLISASTIFSERIISNTLNPKASANGSIVLMSGNPKPVSLS